MVLLRLALTHASILRASHSLAYMPLSLIPLAMSLPKTYNTSCETPNRGGLKEAPWFDKEGDSHRSKYVCKSIERRSSSISIPHVMSCCHFYSVNWQRLDRLLCRFDTVFLERAAKQKQWIFMNRPVTRQDEEFTGPPS